MLDIEDLTQFVEKVKELAEGKNREWILVQRLRKFEEKLRVYSMCFNTWQMPSSQT